MVIETHFVMIAGIIIATLVAVLTVGIEHWRKGRSHGKLQRQDTPRDKADSGEDH